ncbi:MAG: Spy/CpxP family protein refolding chaperone [Bacteriovoracia bacterium]
MKKLLGSFALVAAIAANPAWANKGWSDADYREWKKELALTEAQSAKVDEIHDRSRTKFDSLHDRKLALKEQMKSAFDKNASDAELRRIHRDMMTVKSDMMKLKFDKMLEVRKLLTAEQNKKFMDLKEKYRREKDED